MVHIIKSFLEKAQGLYSIANTKKIQKALDYAVKYHGSQLRASGDPYFYHPIEVAIIIIELGLDADSVITALLHDTIEDTDLCYEDIDREFGTAIAQLVDGVTKLTKIKFQPDQQRQAENFRKLLLAMSDDIRVLLVKLADRLHNMRTIDHISSQEKKARIALETMEIYGPLAERMGIQQFKLELQDISFNVLHAEVRASIVSRLQNLSGQDEKSIEHIIQEIKNTLKKGGLSAHVYGRKKTPYSIWMKMKHKNVSFEQLSDVIAFRILVKTLPDCYNALGIIHSNYKMVPDSFQDFISTPKNNDYQSLHTLVIGPKLQRIEIQIRTEEMHDIAEMGVAAHWKYKQKFKAKDGKKFRWIRELLAILEHSTNSEEFLANTKLAMYYDQVFCFTPKGDLIALPRGATPLDFAYAVHSDVGHHCSGAKINGRIVPLKTSLNNGDQIEIQTSKNNYPSPSWEKIVVTGKARSEIKRFVRTQQKDQYTTLGKAILDKTLKKLNLSEDETSKKKLLQTFKKKNTDELYESIGDGTITREAITQQLSSNNLSSKFSIFKFRKKLKSPQNESNQDNKVSIQGMIPGMAVHYALCCHPLPGDQIVGITHTGKGITVHTTTCEILNNYTNEPEKLINLSWNNDAKKIPHISRLKIIMNNESGSLASLSNEVAADNANITNLKIVTRNVDFFELAIDVEVTDTDHLSNLMSRLNTKKNIHSVEREYS